MNNCKVKGRRDNYPRQRKQYMHRFLYGKELGEDFPGGAVVKNPPANAGDTGSIPGPGRSHMPWSN